MPKTVDTRRHHRKDREHTTIFRNAIPTSVVEDCMLSILPVVPSCSNSFWHSVILTSYFIFNDFYTYNFLYCLGITLMMDPSSIIHATDMQTKPYSCYTLTSVDGIVSILL